MKLLFLTSRLPYPPYRGDKLKIYNLLKQLSVENEITLLSCVASREERKHLPFLKKYCRKIITVYLPTWKSLLNCAGNIFSDIPFQVAYYSSQQMKKLLHEELANHHYDVLHVHLIRMAQYADRISDIPRVLDLTDAGSLYLTRFFGMTKNIIHRVFLGEELKRLIHYERILEAFETCLVCSEVDRKVLLCNAPEASLQLLFNGIDLDYFSSDNSRTPAPFSMIYTGNMTYYPNYDAVRYFVHEIFPLIRQQIPDTKVLIVGKDPPYKVRRLAGEGVVVTGFVPDIKEYYLQSTIAVAPVRIGAGTLNKILEPMALGVPVVSTSLGIQGLPLEPGKDVLIADTPSDFANAAIRLMSDASVREQLSVNAKALVRQSFDWKVVARGLQDVYETICHVSSKE